MTTPSENAVTPASFQFVRSLLRKRSAIELSDDKEYLVNSRLAVVARERSLEGPEAVVQQLRSAPTGDLAGAVIDALTTNETYFFRDTQAFRALKREVLPTLFEKRREQKSIRVWSAACSTGQEPYSLAMMLEESRPKRERWDFQLLGTDISEAALARARSGEYRQDEVNRGLPALYLTRYFRRQGPRWKVATSLMSSVRFEHRNLADPWPASAPFDLVLMRNVLIYFSRETKQEILLRSCRILRADGLLMLGAGETPVGMETPLVRVSSGKSSFYRIGEAPSAVA